MKRSSFEGATSGIKRLNQHQSIYNAAGATHDPDVAISASSSRAKRASISEAAAPSRRRATVDGETAAYRGALDALPLLRTLPHAQSQQSGQPMPARYRRASASTDAFGSVSSTAAAPRENRRRSIDLAALRLDSDQDAHEPVTGRMKRIAEEYASKLGVDKTAALPNMKVIAGTFAKGGTAPLRASGGNGGGSAAGQIMKLDLNPRALLEEKYFHNRGRLGHHVDRAAYGLEDHHDEGPAPRGSSRGSDGSDDGPGTEGTPRHGMHKKDFAKIYTWQGQAPLRFAVLTGSVLISERELAIVHTLFIEANEEGQMTVDGLKRFVKKAGASANMKGSVDLALALCQVLKRREQRAKHQGMLELLTLAWPTLPKEDIEFLGSSVEMLRFGTSGHSDPSAKTATRNLTPAEQAQALSVYALLEKNDSGAVAIETIIKKACASFPFLDPPTLFRQIYKVTPRTYKNADAEVFLKFLAVHLAGPKPLNLSEWSAVLRGSDAVISRWVHRNESLKDDELEDLFNSRPVESGVLKVLYSDKVIKR